MKPIQRKAIELALEALKGSYAVHPDEAITALQDALDETKEIEGLVSIVRTEALAKQSLGEYHGKLMREVCNKVIAKTLADPVKQEPVAWMVTSEGLDGTPNTYPLTGRYKDVRDMCDFGDPVPLYAAPVSEKMQADCTLAAVLAEREACAKVCDEQLKHDWNIQHKPALVNCAAAIRARSEE